MTDPIEEEINNLLRVAIESDEFTVSGEEERAESRNREYERDEFLERFVIEETDSDEEAQDLRDGSDYQKFTGEG